MQAALSVEISFCVVNTEQRGLLRYCLDAIARERATVDFQTEVLVLDNASQDGSADVARQHPVSTEVIALEERRGKGVNDSDLLQRARGRFCLLLNEDSELEPGATAALHAALASDARAGAAGAMLVRPDGEQQPSAWRFPSPAGALMTALFLHQQLVVQSNGERVRRVDWVQSAAMLVRHLTRSGAEWQVSQELRGLVTFRAHNLLDAPPAGGPFDVVFLRNVLIYFDLATKKAILERLRRVMRPDGVLVLGSAETTIGVDDAWVRIPVGGGSVYRPTRPLPATAPSSAPLSTVPQPRTAPRELPVLTRGATR